MERQGVYKETGARERARTQVKYSLHCVRLIYILPRDLFHEYAFSFFKARIHLREITTKDEDARLRYPIFVGQRDTSRAMNTLRHALTRTVLARVKFSVNIVAIRNARDRKGLARAL